MADGSTTLSYGSNKESFFSRFAKWTANASGRPVTFVLALATIVAWGVSGPIFRYSDTWQLVINTGTTIVTFLMVFLIQNTQNRDTTAIHLKLDELIRGLEGPHKALMDLEELSQQELDQIRAHFSKLAKEARDNLRSDEDDPYDPKK